MLAFSLLIHNWDNVNKCLKYISIYGDVALMVADTKIPFITDRCNEGDFFVSLT